MKVHHLPEYGIRKADAASSRATEGWRREEATATAATAAAVETGAFARRRSSSTRRVAASHPPSLAGGVGGGEDGGGGGGGVGGKDDATTGENAAARAAVAPRVSASNRRAMKDAALDSLLPPTSHEIWGSVRHLSEAGARLVMEEVDDCARYCLSYSANARKRRRGDHPPANDGTRAAVEGGRSREDDRGKNLATLAEEIHSYFDMFQPDDYDDEDDDDDENEEDVEGSGASLRFAAPLAGKRQRTDGRPMERRDALRDLLLTEKYDPACLPMVCVKCYPNVLDRAEIVEGLAKDLSRRTTARCEVATTSRPPPCDSLQAATEAAAETSESKEEEGKFEGKAPCVCVVRSTSDLVRRGHPIADVLSQCVSRDSHRGGDFASELRRQRKRTKSHHHGGANNGVLFKSIWSWTRSLVDWAGYTDMFDSIVVILEVSAVRCFVAKETPRHFDPLFRCVHNTSIGQNAITTHLANEVSRKDPVSDVGRVLHDAGISPIQRRGTNLRGRHRCNSGRGRRSTVSPSRPVPPGRVWRLGRARSASTLARGSVRCVV
jgi:hypothetical protein